MIRHHIACAADDTGVAVKLLLGDEEKILYYRLTSLSLNIEIN
jgi:hypothetical protein